MHAALIEDLKEVMSYEGIAKALGMSKSSVWDLQHNPERDPRMKTFNAIQRLHKANIRAINKAKREGK